MESLTATTDYSKVMTPTGWLLGLNSDPFAIIAVNPRTGQCFQVAGEKTRVRDGHDDAKSIPMDRLITKEQNEAFGRDEAFDSDWPLLLVSSCDGDHASPHGAAGTRLIVVIGRTLCSMTDAPRHFFCSIHKNLSRTIFFVLFRKWRS